MGCESQVPMSHAHIRVPKPPQPPSRPVLMLRMFLLGVVLLVIALMAVGRLIDFPERQDWVTADGAVNETRIAVDRIQGSLYGGRISYRLEARVSYSDGGQSYDRWLLVRRETVRAVLEMEVARHPRYCEVYWPPGQPERARCRLR